MNIKGEFIGITKDFRTMFDNSQRGDEIEAWLNEHPEVKKFVILDDDNDMRNLMDHLIQTDFYKKGLTSELADKAIEILNS